MAEDLYIPAEATLQERYELMLKQASALLEDEEDLIANLSNIAALLKQVFDPLWVGFYRMVQGELVLGPFQGPLGCTRIPLNKGVCGAAASQKKTIVVPDVDQFPGHIACSSKSRSEIVVPVMVNTEVVLVLDLDSSSLNNYGPMDVEYLERLCKLLAQHLF